MSNNQNPKNIYDAIIIGAGVCGIVAALELGKAGKNVLLIESGDEHPSDSAQELNEGFTNGDEQTDPGKTRTRAFGGTLHQWEIHLKTGIAGGRFMELTPYDFEGDSENPLSQWPVSYKDIQPYYQKAKEYLEVEGLCANPSEGLDHPLREYFKDTGVVVGEYGVQDFRYLLKKWKTEIENSEFIDLLLNTTVVKISLNEEGNEVEHVITKPTTTPTADEKMYKANHYCLASGVMENVRHLLLNKHPKHPSGIGNNSGWVGKGFMDHSVQPICTVKLPSHLDTQAMAFFDTQEKAQGERIGFLTFSDEIRKKEALANLGMIITPMPSWVNSEGGKALHLLKTDKLKGFLKCLLHWKEIMRLLWAKMRKEAYICINENGWSKTEASRYKASHPHWMIWGVVQQDPEEDNSLSLTEERDLHQNPKISLQWKFSDENLMRFKKSKETMISILKEKGLNALDVPQTPLSGSHHHFGGARMSHTSENGVTDLNGRVHGISNLSVLGNNIACSSGIVNPTLSSLALTLKIIDNI